MPASRGGIGMEVLYPRCAGLDVHKDTVVACSRVVDAGQVQQDVQTFRTTTEGLLALCDWLTEHGCTHVAMEATGVYWKPVWHVLEGHFEQVLANARHVRNVPGRKTDVNDATWLANLLAHGLIRGSYVPPRPVQELRDLTRTRKQLVREAAQHNQRIQKTLEDANLKLTGVMSDVLGVSGRDILNALADGESDIEKLADLGARLKAPRAELVAALRGRVTDHHRFLLKLHLRQIDAIREAVRDLEARLGEALASFRYAEDLLTEMPGISTTLAQVVLSEVGPDVSRFPSAGHLVSWAGLCPRQDESAGKRRSTRIRKGAPWLKTGLVQGAWAAVRKTDSYYRAQFLRLKSRRGPKKAIVAVAASMLTAMYYILRDGVAFHDLGAAYFDTRDHKKTVTRLVRRLKALGCEVEVKNAA
jgi:transposase